MSKKRGIPLPHLNLNQGDFKHEFNPELDGCDYEVAIEYKLGGVPRDFVSPLEEIGVIGDIFYAINQNLPYRYKYPIKHIKKAYLVPMEMK